MRTSREDLKAIASLLYENMNDEMYDDGQEDLGYDDQMGGDEFSTDVVMEIEPVSPVQPEYDTDDNSDLVLKSDLKKLAEYAGRLQELQGQASFEPWMVSKITKASDYVSDVWHMLDAAGADFANTGFEQADQNIDTLDF